MPYDPICGRKLDVKDGNQAAEYKRRMYYFCSHRCREEFEHAAEQVKMQEAARVGALLTGGRVRWGLA